MIESYLIHGTTWGIEDFGEHPTRHRYHVRRGGGKLGEFDTIEKAREHLLRVARNNMQQKCESLERELAQVRAAIHALASGLEPLRRAHERPAGNPPVPPTQDRGEAAQG